MAPAHAQHPVHSPCTRLLFMLPLLLLQSICHLLLLLVLLLLLLLLLQSYCYLLLIFVIIVLLVFMFVDLLLICLHSLSTQCLRAPMS